MNTKLPRYAKALPFLCALLFAVVAVCPSQTSGAQTSKSITIAYDMGSVQWNPLRSYNSIDAELFTAIYEGLVSYDPQTLKPVQGVASSWKISDDKKTYTFSLRKTSFSDGLPVTASIFVDTWKAVLDPALHTPFAGLLDGVSGAEDYRTGKLKDFAKVGIKALDESTLQITLHEPVPFFLQLLCHQSMVPIHPKLLRISDWSKLGPTEIIGNGPYKLTKRDALGVDFSASDTYWDKDSVKVPRIGVRFYDKPGVLNSDYIGDKLQWIVSGADYQNLHMPGHIQVTPQFACTMLYFNNADPAFRNADVRRALTLLLPLEDLRSKDLYSVPTSHLIPQIPSYPAVSAIEKQDVQTAKALLEKAGFPNGKGLPKITIAMPEGDEGDRIAKLLHDAWSGLDCTIDESRLGTDEYYDSLSKGGFTVGELSWIGDYPDPMTFLDLFSTGASSVQSLFSNSEYDKLLADSANQDGKARYKTLAKAEELLLQAAEIIPISHSPGLNVIDLKRIGGWFENPLDLHPVKYFYFKVLSPPSNVVSL